MPPGGHIGEGGVSEVDLVRAPRGGSIGPIFAVAGGAGLDPEKCQLKAVLLLVIAFEVAGVVPPLGAIARVKPVIGRECKITRSFDGEKFAGPLGKNVLTTVDARHEKDDKTRQPCPKQ
jgi:hypothetical protein